MQLIEMPISTIHMTTSHFRIEKSLSPFRIVFFIATKFVMRIHRRIVGPDNTFSLCTQQKTNYLNASRMDGRRPEEIRPVFAKTQAVSQANGSAYLEAGNLKLICSVYGPKEPRGNTADPFKAVLATDFKFAPFANKSKRTAYFKDAQELEFSSILAQALAPAILLSEYPKSVIEVSVLVLENDGSMACLAAAITCASMALVDAGIQMLDVVTACSAASYSPSPNASTIYLDPTSFEEESRQDTGSTLIAYMPSLNEVTHVVHAGELLPRVCSKAVQHCIDACSQIHALIKELLVSESHHHVDH